MRRHLLNLRDRLFPKYRARWTVTSDSAYMGLADAAYATGMFAWWSGRQGFTEGRPMSNPHWALSDEHGNTVQCTCGYAGPDLHAHWREHHPEE